MHRHINILAKNTYASHKQVWSCVFDNCYIPTATLATLLRDWESLVATLKAIEKHPQHYLSVIQFKKAICKYFYSNEFPETFNDLQKVFIGSVHFLHYDRLLEAFRIIRAERFELSLKSSWYQDPESTFKQMRNQQELRKQLQDKKAFQSILIQLAGIDISILSNLQLLEFFVNRPLNKLEITNLFDYWEDFVHILKCAERNKTYTPVVHACKLQCCKFLRIPVEQFPQSISDLKKSIAKLPNLDESIGNAISILLDEVHEQFKKQEVEKALVLFHRDPFYKSLQKIMHDIESEENRLVKKYRNNDKRIPILQATLRKLHNSLQTILDGHLSQDYLVLNTRREEVFTTIKHQCKQNLVNTIKQDLIINKDLGEHRLWGTKFGRILLNAAMMLTVIPAAFKTLFHRTHSPLLNLGNNTQKNLDKIYQTAMRL